MRKLILFIVLVLLIPAVFSLNWDWGISTLKNTFIELTDQFGGDVSGTYDDLLVNQEFNQSEEFINLENNFTAQNDSNYNEFVNISGDTMTGNLIMEGNNITNITYCGIGIDEPEHNLDIVGDFLLTHIAESSDEHGLEIKIDANGIGDVKGIDIIYTTGAIETGEDEEVILVNIDEFDAVGGHVVGLEVVSTEGSADVYGLEAGALVNPLLQLSGVFMDMDSLSNDGVDHRAEFISVVSNVEFFTNDNDYLIIGHSTHFEELEFILNVTAGKNVKPVFEFSTGVGSWEVFTPADGTNGFENNGIIIWDRADVPTWQVGTGGEYLIRITRTRNNIQVAPIEHLVQISDVTEYVWNKDGDMRLRNINASVFNGNIDCSWFIGNTSDLCSLVDTTIADTDTNLTETDVMTYVNGSNVNFNNLIVTGTSTLGSIIIEAEAVYGNLINATIGNFTTIYQDGNQVLDHSGFDYHNNTGLPTCSGTDKLIYDGTDLSCSADTDTDTDTNLTETDVEQYIFDDGIHCGNLTGNSSDLCTLTDTDTNETTNVEALLAQNVSDAISFSSGNLSGNLTWLDLYGFPAACPADSYVTQIDDSITCTELIDTDTDTNLTGADIVSHVGNWSADKGNYYNTTEIEDMNTSLRTDLADTNTWWTIKPEDFINNSNTLELNWTSINDTMDARDTDTNETDNVENLLQENLTIYSNLSLFNLMLIKETVGVGAKLVLREPTGAGFTYVTMTAPTLSAYRTISIPDADVVLADIALNKVEIGKRLKNLSLDSLSELNTQIGQAAEPLLPFEEWEEGRFCAAAAGDKIGCTTDVITESELNTLAELNTQITDATFLNIEYGYIHINDDSAAFTVETAIGLGSAETQSTEVISWTGLFGDNEFVVPNAGKYEITFLPVLSCAASSNVVLDIDVDSVDKNSIAVTCHSSVDPHSFSLKTVATVGADGRMNATVTGSTAVILKTGSSLTIKRLE